MMASSSTALAAVLVPGAVVTSERPSRARWPSHPVGSAVKCSHGCSLGAEHSTRRSPHTVPRPVHLPTRRHHAWSQHPILSLLAGHQHRPRVHVDSSWATCAEWLELRCGGHGRRERGWRGAVSTAISDPRSKPARLWPERASSSASGWRKCPTRAGALTSSSARAEGAAWARTQGAPAPAPPPRAQDVRLMTGCCWAPPTSWPGECDRIHLITGTFGCRVIWCPQLSCSISTGHGTTPGYFSPKAPNAGSPTRGPSSGAGSPAVRSRP